MYSSFCESLPVINISSTWRSAKAGWGKGSHSHLEAESSEPGYWVDVLSSDDGLLRQLRVVEAEVSWDSAPHPVVKILVEAFLPLHSLLCWCDARPSCQPHLVWDVEPPPPLKEQARSSKLKSVPMPGIEVEEEEICVRSLKLHHRHLSSNPAGGHVFVGNLRAEVKKT